MGTGLEILAYASIAASLAGAGVSAYSAHKQGQAEKDMGIYNAKVAQDARKNEELVSMENSKRQRKENERRLSMIKGGLIKNGVNIGTGSSLDVISQSAGELELAAMDMFRNSDAKQRQLTNQGAMSIWQGGQAAEAANISAIGTLIGGVASAGSSYSDFRRTGAIS